MKWVLQSSVLPTTHEQLLEVLLANRSLNTKSQRQEFLHPTHPMQLSLSDVGIDEKEMKKAISLIHRAQKEHWNVLVFGDYDCDGICGTTVLWETLYAMGIRAMPFIPERDKHGYGLSLKALEDILTNTDQTPHLLITVDNGVVAYDAFKLLHQKGIKTILTDHHQSELRDGAQYPQTDAVIHTTKLCGTTVGWMLARALDFKKAESMLDLCAIATIADQVPLLNANRSFAKHGITAIRESKRIGLNFLIEYAGLDKAKIDTYAINYGIAPRINAMGRIGDPKDALRLLCSTKEAKVRSFAQSVQSTNTDRQSLTTMMIEEAMQQKDAWTDEHIIVVHSDTFHEGVIGLVAGKLMETFAKPAIVIARGAKSAKGSARSVPGVNITDLLRQLKDELLDVGGHPMAAGFSVANENVEHFASLLRTLGKKIIDTSLLVKSLQVECEISANLINTKTIESLQSLEPYGSGNSVPVFVVRDFMITQHSIVGKDQRHRKLVLQRVDGSALQAMWFGGASHEIEPLLNTQVELAVTLQFNEWNGKKSVQVVVKAGKEVKEN